MGRRFRSRGRRKGAITLGVGFDDFVDKLTLEGVAAAKKTIEEALEDIVEDAAAQWPVGATGRSRNAFRVEIDEDPATITGIIINDSGYAPFINGGRTLHALVVVPFNTAVALLPAEIARALSEID